MHIVKYVKSGETVHWKVILVRAVQATGMTELIPTVRMESQHSVGGPTCHHFPRFVIISEKSWPEVGSR